MANTREKIYECEVKKLFLRNGVKGWQWVRMTVTDALAAEAYEIRCKDCHGAVRMHKHVGHGPAPHVEHKRKADSEHCPCGFYFQAVFKSGSATLHAASLANTPVPVSPRYISRRQNAPAASNGL